MTPPPRSNTPPSEGDIFFTIPTEYHKPDSILQKYRILHKVQNITNQKGFYKLLAEVPSDTVNAILKRVLPSPPVARQPYRVPPFSHGISGRTLTSIEYGRALFLFPSRPSPRGRQGASFAPRRGLPTLRTGGGVVGEGVSATCATPSLKPVAAFFALTTNKGKKKLTFWYQNT